MTSGKRILYANFKFLVAVGLPSVTSEYYLSIFKKTVLLSKNVNINIRLFISGWVSLNHSMRFETLK